MKDCIFCKIIKKDLPSYTIYEDNKIKIIMNINPIINGHLLILPKNHYENLLDLEDDYLIHSKKIIKDKIYPLLKEKLNCDGLTICQNNDYGQEIKHFHLHLIPRYKNDNLEFTNTNINTENVETIFNKLKK